MPAWQLDFGIFSLVAVIMLVMAGVSLGYLLSIPNRSRASQLLLGLFLCVVLSALATLVTNLGMAWNRAFAPAQDAFLILGGIFLSRFAYAFPAQEDVAESRLVAHTFDSLAALAIGYAVYFAFAYLSSLPVEIDETRAYYLLTPITMTGVVLVLFRRSISVSRKALAARQARINSDRGTLRELLQPGDLSAVALRNFGLALSVGLLPLIVFLIKPALPALLASFFFNFGIVISISAIMLVYLNYAPEPTTLLAKLVGINLVTVLLVLGFTCILLLHLFPSTDSHSIVSIFIVLVLGGAAFVLLAFPIFFRATLLEPLGRLLEGHRAANEGQLGYRVDVVVSDEIGFLSRSFNRMIESIRELTSRLEARAEELEAEVSERTQALQTANAQLMEENRKREEARSRLDRQLRYQTALAKCSQVLLSGVDRNGDRTLVLTEGLEALRSGVDASRAYVHRAYIDPDGAGRVGIFAEACAPGVNRHIDNPANQDFPLSALPVSLVGELEAGRQVGGPVAQVFEGNPLVEIMLNQSPPLLSLLLFPLHVEGRWWGFVGFDDCETQREWDEQEAVFLRTASEVIGGTIQRWEIHAQLVGTLEELERRVEERTRSLNEINVQLQEEIAARVAFQAGLEKRLNTEQLLARASAHIVKTHAITVALEDVLRDLGEIMQAGSFALMVPDSARPGSPLEVFEWRLPRREPLDRRFVTALLDPAGWAARQLEMGERLWIQGRDRLPPEAGALVEAMTAGGVDSWILWPLVTTGERLGLLLCAGSSLDEQATSENLRSLEVFVSLLSNMLERESILRTLEQRVTEQTRELSTLYEMTMLTSSASEISEILSPALARILEISGGEAACIHLYAPQAARLDLIAHRGFPARSLSGLVEIAMPPELLEWLEKPEPAFTGNQLQPRGIPGLFGHPDYRFFAISKLRAAGNTQGVITCYSGSPDPFTPFQISMLAVIGELLGVAVENHHLGLESKKLATVQERHRLARELHDAVSQSVYSLSLFARSARDAQEAGDGEKLAVSLEQLEVNSLAAVREMRLLLYQLRALALEEGDLGKAVESRLELVERRSGMRAEVYIDERVELDPRVEQELFHVIIEALNNTLHYARAERVAVHLALEKGELALRVEDDGIGFDPARVRPGMGLQNMRERAEALLGTFELSSRPGEGTRIGLRLPGTLVRVREGLRDG